MFTPFLIAAILGYFLGAIPIGFLVARARGVNIFEVGSKSPGATNVKRVLGARAGNLVFALDMLKGAVAGGWLLVWRWLDSPVCSCGMENLVAMQIAGVLGALLGHSFSCFTKFKGGKGVATGAGGFLVLMSVPTLIGLAVWAVTYYATRYVSLASILGALTVPTVGYLMDYDGILVGISLAVCGFVIVRHRTNIVRLCQGTEHKFVRKSEKSK